MGIAELGCWANGLNTHNAIAMNDRFEMIRIMLRDVELL